MLGHTSPSLPGDCDCKREERLRPPEWEMSCRAGVRSREDDSKVRVVSSLVTAEGLSALTLRIGLGRELGQIPCVVPVPHTFSCAVLIPKAGVYLVGSEFELPKIGGAVLDPAV